MADPRAFISFDFDHDEKQRMLFAGQSRNSRTPFSVQNWSSKEAVPQRTWEETIEDKIGRCNLAIVLVGRFMASAGGVTKEIAMASRREVPVFGVYVDGAGMASNLPAGLPRGRVIPWTWPGVADMIDRTLREGKNRPSIRLF